MATVQDIKAYAEGDARNKIVVSASRIAPLLYVDVGRELATMLERLGLNANADALCGELFARQQRDESIGKYLAIDNIGILFEPDLHLNIRALLGNASKSQTLIIRIDGELKESLTNELKDKTIYEIQ